MAQVFDWLPPWWPWSLVLLAMGFAVFVWRDPLLDWGPGKYWPAVTAILAPAIPIVRSFEDNTLPSGQAVTVGLILLAIAATQLYGQERAERYRKLADAEVRSISAEVRDLSAEVRAVSDRGRQQLGFLAEQGAQLGDIADAIGSIADEIRRLKETIEERDS